MNSIRALVTSDAFRSTILFVIVLNAFAMGLEATPSAAEKYRDILEWFFLLSQTIFVFEMILRFVAAPPGQFFRDSWNRFDFVIVALSLIPQIGGFTLVARTFRVLRVLRIVSVTDVLFGRVLRNYERMRSACLSILLIGLVIYMFALLGFHLFGEQFGEWSSLARSASMLFLSASPTAFAGLMKSGTEVALLVAVFYLVTLSIVANLALAIGKRSRGATS